MRSYMDHTVLPAYYTMPAFTPQPQSITALWLVLIYRPTEGRRLSRPGTWIGWTPVRNNEETNDLGKVAGHLEAPRDQGYISVCHTVAVTVVFG